MMMKQYPLTAAQKMHDDWIKKYKTQQVSGVSVVASLKAELDFGLLKKCIQLEYERYGCMRIRFTKRDKNGDLSRINSVNIDGMRGCFLSTDVDGKYLYVAGYHDGKVTVVHTHKDGRLGSLMDGVFHTGLGSVAERNFRPHVNCVRPTPDNKYLCAVDNGIDQVKIYRVNKLRNKLELVAILRCPRAARVSFVLAMMVSLLIFSLNSVMRSGLTNMMEAVRFRRLN